MLTDAVNLLFERSDFFFELFVQHMVISLISIFFACVIGLVLGILISEKMGAAKPTLSVVNFLYTIPSLALLGLLIPFTGAGQTTAIIALTAYGLLPIVKNTHIGICNINPAIIEAARGMGSTRWQMLFKIKLPLAFPVIMSGFRNMVTMTISLTSIAAYIGAGGLGTAIFRGISTNNMAMVLVGSILTALLAVAVDLLLGVVERRVRRQRSERSRRHTLIGFGVAVLAVIALIGGTAFSSIQQQDTIRVTSKAFTEQLVMGEILSQYVDENTDYNIELTSAAGTSTIQPGLESGEYDMYVEYTGTGWAEVLHNEGVYQEDQFEDLQAQYNSKGITWTSMLGYENTYGIAVRTDVAEQYNLKTYSDLAAVSSELKFGGNPEFLERQGDGYSALCEEYGMEFASTIDLDTGLKYNTINAGEVDVIEIFTTDGQLGSADVVVLEDDRNFFPSYQAGVVVRQEVLDRHPDLNEVLARLNDCLDETTMAELNNRVDSNGEDPETVAHDFLVSAGLIEG